MRIGGTITLEPRRVPVSIVIPCFCCGDTIERAVESVAKQTALPYEIILVNDASPDGCDTLDALSLIASRYSDVFQVEIISLKTNVGSASARNRGWQIATQPYLAFLDADDAWHPRKVEYQFGWMVQHPSYGLVGHAHMPCGSDNFAWPDLCSDIPVLSVSQNKALLSNPFATPTVMLKSDLPFRFKDGKRYAEDYLLWLQIICSGVPTAYICHTLAATFKKDFGENGLSSNLWLMELGELDAYKKIWSDRKIASITFAALAVFSFLKFIRRALLVYGFKRR